MAEVIEIRGDKAIMEKLAKMANGMRPAAAEATYAGAAHLLSSMKSRMLSGQRLRVRTGKLRSNWAIAVPREESGAVVCAVSTNTTYAPVHEYGFSGTVAVREHTRRPTNRRGSRGVRVAGRKRTTAPAAVITVRAHDRHMHLPARRYLRDTLVNERVRTLKIMEQIFRRRIRGD